MLTIKISKHRSLWQYFRYAIFYGAVAAISMSAFEFFIHLLGLDHRVGWHMLNYLVFFLILGIGAYRAAPILNEGYEANDTVIIGLMISASTALFQLPLNLLFVLFHIPVEVGILILPISTGFKFFLNAMGNFLVDVSFGFLASIIMVYLFNRN